MDAREALVTTDRGLLATGHAANPPPGRRPRQRGRVKQMPVRTRLERLWLGQDEVLAFLDDLTIPFDNDVVAYCTPSAWLACFVRRVWSLFVGWRKQRNPTAIGLIHGNATSSPPIPDRLLAYSIGFVGRRCGIQTILPR